MKKFVCLFTLTSHKISNIYFYLLKVSINSSQKAKYSNLDSQVRS